MGSVGDDKEDEDEDEDLDGYGKFFKKMGGKPPERAWAFSLMSVASPRAPRPHWGSIRAYVRLSNRDQPWPPLNFF